MVAIFKKLLIPLCHSFILLPIGAILSGSPAIGGLTMLLLFLFALSCVGWLFNEMYPHRWPVWIGMAMLLGLGMLLGYTCLPDLFCRLAYGSNYGLDALNNWTSGPEPKVGEIQSWMAPVFGAIAGIIMIWSQLECRRGLETGLPTHKLGIGLALYIFTYFSYRSTGLYIAADKSDLFQPIYLYGALWLILATVVINYQFILRMAASKNQPRPSKAVLLQNILMSFAIAGGSIFISCFGFLRNAFNRMLQNFAALLATLSGHISEWMMTGPQSEVEEEDNEPLYAPDQERPEWVEILTSVIIWTVVIVLVGAALWLIGRKLWSLILTFKQWMSEKLTQWQQEESSYQEEEESLMGWDQLRKELGEKIKIRRKPVTRFEDQPDARAKVRWVYARLREQLIKKHKFNDALTPSELAETQFADNSSVKNLLEDYNEARYSEHAMKEEQAREGLDTLRKLRL